jgi:tetratricopeptide (TPR) repeat protein
MKLKSFYCLFCLALFASANAFAQAGLDFFVKAEELRNARQYAPALEMYAKALEKEPNKYEYKFKQCGCFSDAQRYEDALKCYLELRKVNAKDLLVAEQIGSIYRLLGKNTESIAAFEECVKLAEDKGQKFIYKNFIIEMLLLDGKVSQVEPHLKEAKKYMPENDEIFYLEARFYNAMGKFKQAAEAAGTVVKRRGSEEQSEELNKFLYELAYANHMLGLYDLSKESIAKITPGPPFDIKLKEMSADFYCSAAEAYYSIFEFSKALELLEISLKIDEKHAKSIELKTKIEKSPSPGNEISNINKNLPKTPPAQQKGMYAKLALLYYKQGDFDNALSSANQYLSMDPRNTSIIFIRGLASHKVNDNDEAENVLQNLGNTPKVEPRVKLQALFALGMVQKNTNQLALAKKSFKKAKRGPFESAAKYEIRDINLKLRQSGDAAGEEPEDDKSDDKEGDEK